MPSSSKQTKGRRRVAGQVDYVALSRDLVDAVESGVYIVQSKKFVYVNAFCARLTGYSREELIGMRSFKLVLPQDRPLVRKKATRNLKSRTGARPYEYRFIKKNGEIIWVMERVSPIAYMGQKAALGSLMDITPRKQLEEALAHSEETYRTMLEQMYDSYYEVDLAGNFTFVNDSVCRNLGYSSEEMVGQSYRFTTPPGDVKPLLLAFGEVFRTGNPHIGFAHGILRKDGSLISVESSISLRQNAQGEIIGFRSVSRDITERKKAEQALLFEKQYSDAVIDSLPGLFYILDERGNFIRWNKNLEIILGYSVEELPGMNALATIAEEDKEPVAGKILETFSNGNAAVEANVLTKSGQKIPHYLTGVRIIIEDKIYLVGEGIDITERKQAENALRDSEERYRALFDRSPDLVYVRDLKGNFIDANPASLGLLGYRREDIPTLNFASLLDPAQFPRTIQILKELTETGFQKEPGEFKLKRKDGTYLYVETQESVIYRNGKPHSVQGVGRDITGRKKADEALKESETKYRLLVETTTEVILVVQDLKIKFFNRRAIDLTGYSGDELNDMPFANLVYPDDLEMLAGQHQRRLQGEPFERVYPFRYVLKGGKVGWAEISTALIDWEGRPATLSILTDVTERKQAETYREMGREVLQVLNEPGNLQDSIQRVLATLKTRTGLDAVGIRLQDGDDFPYFAQQGFSRDFLLTENTLVERAADGGVCRDKDGNVSLECTCGLVISGQTDPANPYFTQGGSCWTNDQAGTPFQDTRLHPRDRCLHDGFQSVALVPIRNKDGIVGLIQLNDRRKGCFTLEPVELLEGIAAHIGEALMRKRAEEELRKAEEKYRSLVENINDVFYVLDKQGNITYVSPVVERLSKYKISDLIGKPFIPLVYPDDLPALLESFNRLVSGQLEPWEFRILDKDGRIIWVRTSSRPLYEDGEIVGITALMTDITGRKQMEQKLEEMATHDFLTGLPNRLLLLDRFTIAAALAHRNKARLAVMSLDLDRFKTINDTLGHDAGDQVLKAVSARLTGIIRASDTVARIGGDEFILVMMETGGMKDTAATAQKILDSFAEPLSIDGHQLHLTTSIGIAIYPADAQDLETLTKQSDAAMYYSKGHGRNRLKFFGDGDVRAGGDRKSAPLV
jgi:diguanylate cyclase (GGDEF)-like protein/PAS domain S-box-containing protein